MSDNNRFNEKNNKVQKEESKKKNGKNEKKKNHHAAIATKNTLLVQQADARIYSFSYHIVPIFIHSLRSFHTILDRTGAYQTILTRKQIFFRFPTQ